MVEIQIHLTAKRCSKFCSQNPRSTKKRGKYNNSCLAPMGESDLTRKGIAFLSTLSRNWINVGENPGRCRGSGREDAVARALHKLTLELQHEIQSTPVDQASVPFQRESRFRDLLSCLGVSTPSFSFGGVQPILEGLQVTFGALLFHVDDSGGQWLETCASQCFCSEGNQAALEFGLPRVLLLSRVSTLSSMERTRLQPGDTTSICLRMHIYIYI